MCMNYTDTLLVPCRVNKTGQILESHPFKGAIAAPCWTEPSWSTKVNKNDSLSLRDLRFIANFWSWPLLVLIFKINSISEQTPSSLIVSFLFLYSKSILIGRTCPGAIEKSLSSSKIFIVNWCPGQEFFTIETLVTFSHKAPWKLLTEKVICLEKSLPSTRSGKNAGANTWKVCFASRGFMLQVKVKGPLCLMWRYNVWIPLESWTDDLVKQKYSKGMKEAVSRNSAIIGNYKMPVKLRET